MDEHSADNRDDWSREAKASLVVRVLQRELSLDEAAGLCGVPTKEIEEWVRLFLRAGEDALAPGATADLERSDAAGDRQSSGVAAAEEVGVWVCAFGEASLAPCLFMQAVADGSAPEVIAVGWQGAGSSPRELGKSGKASLLHGKGTEAGGGRLGIHLFAARTPDARVLETRTGLADWDLAVPVRAAALLLDRQATPRQRRAHDPLPWLRAQKVPYLVAGMGFGVAAATEDERAATEDSLRRGLRLHPGVPVLLGPGLAHARPAANASTPPGRAPGRLASLLLGGDLEFSRDYAARIMQTLERLVSGA